ncbi:MAG: transglutaminase family protein [Bryobacteraceae bacterium]|nr:transglutaminase family protein [Bryobacteraceae bacterium]
MLIRLGYDMQFGITEPVAMIALLHVYPTRSPDLQEPDLLRIEPVIPVQQYIDSFGNRCSRFLAPAGNLRLSASTVIQDSGEKDPIGISARQMPIDQLPSETLQYLLNSRYCEVDQLVNVATDLFGSTAPGWSRVQTICDWVNKKVEFGYNFARPNKSALDVYTERTGVCRDFQHLAVTFCRCMNIPARYATGYLPDIHYIPPYPSPMDFSAWFEVYLEDRWWTFDARHNVPRAGRVLMAVGRDAADVALTTSFGSSRLTWFSVVADEIV